MRAWLSIVLVLGVPSVALGHTCPSDATLEEVAVQIATDASALEETALRELVRDAGGSMLIVRALRVAPDDTAAVDAWLAVQRGGTDAPIVCGEVESETARVVLAAERAGVLELVPGETPRIKARVEPGFVAQYIVFQGADGRFVRVPATRALADGEPLPESLQAPLQVQLVAEGRRGPRPVAELSVGRDGEQSDSSTHAIRAIARARGDEEVPARVTRLRREASVSSLRPNRLLDEAARAYAGSICAGGRVVHRTLTGEGPRERLLSRGIDARVVGETIARAASRAEALAALESSPSHLATLQDRRFTDGGYGVASDARGRRCVVIVLAAWPRAIVSR